MTIENLVKKFLEDEKFTLRNMLAYGGLGLAKATGEINEVVMDIAFNGHSYNDERKEHVEDSIGMLLFCAHIFAQSIGRPIEEISQRFVNLFLIKNKQTSPEMQASLLELMKHVKTEVHTRDKLKYEYTKTNDRQDDQIYTKQL